jgi:hypothetical protein
MFNSKRKKGVATSKLLRFMPSSASKPKRERENPMETH